MTKSTKVSLILNIAIFLMVLVGTVFSLTGVKMTGSEDVLTEGGFLQFFTVQSNILAGLMSLCFAIFTVLSYKGKIKEIPAVLYGLKLVFTVGVALTLTVVLFVLAPFAKTGYFSMFRNSNLLFHLLVPVCSIVTLIFFECRKDIKFYFTFIGMSHMVAYGIYYIITVVTHMENGTVPAKYDWYQFAANGTVPMLFICLFIIALAYLISFFLWFFNRKVAMRKVKAD